MKKIFIAGLVFLFLLSCNTLALSYGEMWNYTTNVTAWTFPIGIEGVYYNLSNISAGSLNGFTFHNLPTTQGGSHLQAEVAGTYKATAIISHSAEGKALYGLGIVKNWNVTDNRQCYTRHYVSKENVVMPHTVDCILDLDVYDNVSLQIEDEQGTTDILVHTVNLNIVELEPDESNWMLSIILALVGTAFIFIFMYKSIDSIHIALRLLFLMIGIIMLVISANVILQFVISSGYILDSSVVTALTNITSGFYWVMVIILYFTSAYFIIMFLKEVFIFLANIRKR